MTFFNASSFYAFAQARELLQKGEELPALLVASMLEEKLLSLEVQHYGRFLNRLVATHPALQHWMSTRYIYSTSIYSISREAHTWQASLLHCFHDGTWWCFRDSVHFQIAHLMDGVSSDCTLDDVHILIVMSLTAEVWVIYVFLSLMKVAKCYWNVWNLVNLLASANELE